MVAFFNNKFIEDQLTLSINDRALQFGDGLFETIMVQNNDARLLSYHLERLTEGASLMQMSLPEVFTKKNVLASLIKELMSKNAMRNGRVKLIVWRNHFSQQGYTSNDNSVNYLITAKNKKTEDRKKIIRAGVCEFVKNHHWKMSRFKKLSALQYVIAAQERDQRQLDELILLDVHGNVSECIYSNIFWITDRVVYTPPLSTGCVSGVMRRFIIDYLNSHEHQVQETECNIQVLKSADMVFTTNSMGVQVINNICGITYSKSDTIMKSIEVLLT